MTANFCNFDFQLDFPGQISIQSLLIYTVLKLVLPVILKEIQSVFLISILRLLQNVSLNYHFTSYSFLVSVYSCSSYSLPSKKFTLILRASRQMPFRITTKNVLQFISRRRTADSAKEKLKGKFLKGMICLREGRRQQTSTRLQYR